MYTYIFYIIITELKALMQQFSCIRINADTETFLSICVKSLHKATQEAVKLTRVILDQQWPGFLKADAKIMARIAYANEMTQSAIGALEVA